MTTKVKSNGFGSFELFLIFTVDKSHSTYLINDGWKAIEETSKGSVFKYHFTSRKRGDDETAMFELGYSLPKEVTLENYNIDWDRSVF